jgi:hypothetical protein
MELEPAKIEDIEQRTPRMHGRPWGAIAEKLKASPGEWFEVKDHGMTQSSVQVYCSNIRRGILMPFRPAGTFDAKYEGTRLWVSFKKRG